MSERVDSIPRPTCIRAAIDQRECGLNPAPATATGWSEPPTLAEFVRIDVEVQPMGRAPARQTVNFEGGRRQASGRAERAEQELGQGAAGQSWQ